MNPTQLQALQWLMTEEVQEKQDDHKINWEMAALAANPNTNPELIKRLNMTDEEILEDEDLRSVTWVTPETPEELDAILEDFSDLFG